MTGGNESFIFRYDSALSIIYLQVCISWTKLLILEVFLNETILRSPDLLQYNCKEIQPVHPKEDQSWVFIGRTDVEAETPILWPPDVKSWLIWKDSDAGKELRAVEGDDGGWDGWMASPTRWTWVWASSGSWWWTGKPGVLLSMGLQRVGHNWATELNWTEWLLQTE